MQSGAGITAHLAGLPSGKLLIGTFALIIISFYSGTLFGERRLVYTPGSVVGNQNELTWLPNRISVPSERQVPEDGMHVCPQEFSELIPCHNRSFSRMSFKDLNYERKEDLEKHCPPLKVQPFCLVPPPAGYRISVRWPKSREFVWRVNVNHSKLAEVKGGQNWLHENGSMWWFPGGGTHFKHGAQEYIERAGLPCFSTREDFPATHSQYGNDVATHFGGDASPFYRVSKIVRDEIQQAIHNLKWQREEERMSHFLKKERMCQLKALRHLLPIWTTEAKPHVVKETSNANHLRVGTLKYISHAEKKQQYEYSKRRHRRSSLLDSSSSSSSSSSLDYTPPISTKSRCIYKC
ncbi:hypothetical protein L7F22_033183 [Adiantum nelumboides]|nr:hypothetical protein [Adiantum nelumboides]